jgi:hypothetical protein
MTAITVPITEEGFERLKARADEAGVSAEEMARRALEEWLARSDEEFSRATDYVMRKNAELYRRLA